MATVNEGALMTAAEYEQLVLEDREGHWELVRGRPRRKPPVTFGHDRGMDGLSNQLHRQLDDDVYQVRTGRGRLRVSTGSYYEPDLVVMPIVDILRRAGDPRAFEVHDLPVPFVVEVWSRSTGAYDRDTKLAEYRLRGDAEIWLLNPYRRTIAAWRCVRPDAPKPDAQYDEQVLTGGRVELFALPGVVIDIDRLFPSAAPAGGGTL